MNLLGAGERLVAARGVGVEGLEELGLGVGDHEDAVADGGDGVGESVK